MIVMVFAAAAGMISMSTAFNALSDHGACTAVFIAVSAIAGALVASIQTLGRIQALGWVGIVSILSAGMFFPLKIVSY